LWLARNPPDLDEARKAAERVIRNGHHAGDVIRSIRAMIRKARPEMAELDINDVVTTSLDLMTAEFRRHDIVLAIDLAPAPAPVIGDRVQLQQVVTNLVTNGIEAMAGTARNARNLQIRTRLFSDQELVTVIEDSGPGIATAEIDQIFQPLYTTKSDGMGLGLTICRSIVEAHGGRLWVSPGAATGSQFQFTLPIAGVEQA
jgi:signal transduction histidine kinase